MFVGVRAQKTLSKPWFLRYFDVTYPINNNSLRIFRWFGDLLTLHQLSYGPTRRRPTMPSVKTARSRRYWQSSLVQRASGQFQAYRPESEADISSSQPSSFTVNRFFHLFRPRQCSDPGPAGSEAPQSTRRRTKEPLRKNTTRSASQ